MSSKLYPSATLAPPYHFEGSLEVKKNEVEIFKKSENNLEEKIVISRNEKLETKIII